MIVIASLAQLIDWGRQSDSMDLHKIISLLHVVVIVIVIVIRLLYLQEKRVSLLLLLLVLVLYTVYTL